MDLDARTLAEDLLADKPILHAKLEAACGVETPDEARAAIIEALRFMALTGHARGSLTPSKRVDAAWHELILCTREYAALCETHFGRFVHHDPGGDEALNRDRFAQTLRLYTQHFGPPPRAWWGRSLEFSADCGACETPP